MNRAAGFGTKLSNLIRSRSSRRHRNRRPQPRYHRLRVEALESRRLLAVATNLANIEGRVYNDLNGDGFTAGEQLAGVTLNLYRDNGNGVFEPGAGDQAAIQSHVTNSSGIYQMSNLTAGSYFVQQPAQTIGGVALQQQVSNLITINSTQVEGQLVRTIDSFDVTTQEVSDTTNDGTQVSSSKLAPEVLGGERDIFVNKTSATGLISIGINDPLLPGILSFDSRQFGDGQWNVTWDGIDSDPLTVNDNGLGAVDLTSGGAAKGFRLAIGADNPGGNATVIVYTNDGIAGSTSRSSQTVLQIPNTGGSATSTEYIPFSSFTGNADFTQVGAIVLDIAGVPNINGTAELVGAIGPTVVTHDFDNFVQADLSLTMSASTTAPAIGQNVTFTINLANAGPSVATGISVIDQLPSGITFVSDTPTQGTYNRLSGLWTVGSLGVGASASLQLVGTMTGSGTQVNTAQVQSVDQTDPDSTPGNSIAGEDDQASVSVAAQIIDLSLTQSASNATPNIGEDVTFTITISNAGPSTATGVAVTDLLPAGLTLVSHSPTQGNYANLSGLWTVGELGVGNSAVLTLVARVASNGSKTNTAEVTAAQQTDIDSTPGNNVPTEDDQASVTVSPQSADLSLTMTADTLSPNIDQTVAITLTVANAGPSTATGVTVTDLLPAGIAYVSNNPSIGFYEAASGLWTVGSIAAGTSQTLTLIGRIDSVGEKTNTAQITTSDQFDPDSTPGNSSTTEDDIASITLAPPTADLSLTKTVNNASPNLNENVTFTITVRNSGPNQATGVVVRDLLPDGSTFVSHVASQGTYDSGTGLWTLGTLSNGGTANLRIVAKGITEGTKTNTAEIMAADQLDPDSTPGDGLLGQDDIATVTFTPQVIDLSLTNTANQPQPNLGENVTFTITLFNAGPATATNIRVADRLQTGLTFVSATASQGSFNSSSRVWTVPSLSASGTATLNVVARVNTATTLTNTAEVIAADQPDIDSTPGNNVLSEDDQAQATVSTRIADLELTNVVSNPTPNVGDEVTYTITVNNLGPDDATGVVVVDSLPQGMTYRSNSTTAGTFAVSSRTWNVGSIPTGQSVELNLVARVDTRGPKVNTAQVTKSDQADPNSTPGNNVASENDQASSTLTPQLIDLALTSTVDPTRPDVGQEVVYQLKLTNSGPDTASGVQVTDRLPEGLTFVSSSASLGSYDEFSGVWTVGSVAKGISPTLDIVATVTSLGTFTNVAEVTAADQLDIDSTPGNRVTTEDDYTSTSFQPYRADLSLTKTVDNAKPNVDENVTFTILVTNSGPDRATGVEVTDLLPEDVTFVSYSSNIGTYESSTGIWTIGTLVNQGVARLNVVAIGATVGTKINDAEITASDTYDPDSTPGNHDPTEDDQASVEFDPQQIDLSVTESISNQAPNLGESVVYTITVSNAGPSDATGVIVGGKVPKGLIYQAAKPSQGTFNPSTGNWNVGKLGINTTATLQVTAQVNTHGTVIHTVEVLDADQPDVDSTPGNGVPTEDDIATVSFTTPVADLSLTNVVSNGTPLAIEDVIFTITVLNNGPDGATNVVVQDLLPEGLLFVKAEPTQGTYDPITGLWNVGDIANTAIAILKLHVRPNSPDTVTNTAQVYAVAQGDPDSTPDNNDPTEDDQASASITPKLIDLSVTASVDNATPELGQTVITTFSVTNAGPEVATGVTLLADLPTGITFVKAEPEIGTYDETTGIWDVGILGIGETYILRIYERVDVFGYRTQWIEVETADQFDVDSTPGNQSKVEDDYASILIQAPRNLSKRMFLSR